ncbi:MAG: hypothetical protein IKE01_00680 [Clostridia bacterium]|nr:hypothetical protein [Clostridia bacterium]
MTSQFNILKWYSFERKAKIYELHKGTSIFKDSNMELDVTSCCYKNFKIDGKYDYITLIGTYEYAPLMVNLPNPYVELLKKLKSHLNENGKLLLAIDNRIGVKYLVGGRSELYHKIFEGIESCICNTLPNLLTKNEIITQINSAGYNFYKFYYPLPDYKNTSVIYSDQYLPKSNHSKIKYPAKYDKGSIILYSEEKAIKQICNAGLFDNLTNSFLVELSNNNLLSKTKFVSYNTYRKCKYQTILTIESDKVQKVAANSISQKHIDEIGWNITKLKELDFNIVDQYANGKIESEYVQFEELDKQIVTLIQNNKIDESIKLISSWYTYISDRLHKQNENNENIFRHFKIDIPESIKSELIFVKEGFIDLSFENTFFYDDYMFYDQEWYYENVPLQFILYRAISNLYIYHCQDIEKEISKDEMLKKFGIDIYLNYFTKLEVAIQAEILDNNAIEKNNENLIFCNIEQLRAKEKDVEILAKRNEELKNEVSYLESDYKKLAKERSDLENNYKSLQSQKENIEIQYQRLLDEYNNSRGWKIIKQVRKIVGKG